MKKHPIRILAAVLLVSVGLSGCTTTNFVSGVPTTNREKQAIREARGAGAGLGALIGIGAGILIAESRGQKVGVPAAIGGITGALIGDEAGRRKGVEVVENHRREKFGVEQLKSTIASARQYNDSAHQYNQELAGRVREIQSTISAAEARSALTSATRQHGNFASRIQFRKQQAANLPSGFSSQYLGTNVNLAREKTALEASIAKLRKISQEKG